MKKLKDELSEEVLTTSDKILIVAGYLFWFPSFYIILSDKRKNKTAALHASQAMMLWILLIFFILIMKILFNFILSIFHLHFLYAIFEMLPFLFWLYCVYCAGMFMVNREFEIPVITDVSKKLI